MAKQNIGEALGILLVSAVLAISANELRSDGLPLVREKAAQPVASNGPAAVPVLSLEAFIQVSRQPGVVILDARTYEDFQEAHVPGARSLPYASSEEQTAAVLSDVGYDREIVVYCSGSDCEAAEEVALQLREHGYADVRVFSGGWDEWIAGNQPIETGAK